MRCQSASGTDDVCGRGNEEWRRGGCAVCAGCGGEEEGDESDGEGEEGVWDVKVAAKG